MRSDASEIRIQKTEDYAAGALTVTEQHGSRSSSDIESHDYHIGDPKTPTIHGAVINPLFVPQKLHTVPRCQDERYMQKEPKVTVIYRASCFQCGYFGGMSTCITPCTFWGAESKCDSTGAQLRVGAVRNRMRGSGKRHAGNHASAPKLNPTGVSDVCQFIIVRVTERRLHVVACERIVRHHPIVDTIFVGHMLSAVRLWFRTPTSIGLFTLASLELPSMNCMAW